MGCGRLFLFADPNADDAATRTALYLASANCTAEAAAVAGKHRVTFSGRAVASQSGRPHAEPSDARVTMQPAGERERERLVRAAAERAAERAVERAAERAAESGDYSGEDEGDAGALAELECGADLGNGHEIWDPSVALAFESDDDGSAEAEPPSRPQAVRFFDDCVEKVEARGREQPLERSARTTTSSSTANGHRRRAIPAYRRAPSATRSRSGDGRSLKGCRIHQGWALPFLRRGSMARMA